MAENYKGSITLASVENGQDGAPGAAGVGIDTTATVIKYAVSDNNTAPPSSGWNTSWPSNIPQGSYLWTWTHLVYTDSTSSDDYTVAYQGEDGAERLIIESSDEKIYKFYTSQGNKQYSPEEITLWVHNTGTSDLLVPGTDYDHELGLIGTDVNDYKNLWNFFNRLYGNVGTDAEGHQTGRVLELVREISNNQIKFKIDVLSELVLEIGTGKTSAADAQLFENLRSILYNNNYYLNFRVYTHSSNVPPVASGLLIQKPIGVEFGTSDDMAQFGLTAANINMLVRDSKLTFDAEGLHIENGAFDITDVGYHSSYPTAEEFNNSKTDYYIYNEGSDTYTQCTNSTIYDANTQYYTYGSLELLAYDPTLQTLRVNGNGSFTGRIEATDGYFSGELRGASGTFEGSIQANSGEIGGWVIKENGLYSTATDENESSLLELLGAEGIINAQTINLGTGAHINNYIQLGNNAILYNPDNANGRVLSSGDILLLNNGQLQLGDLLLDGAQSTINGNNWSIDPEFARFKNVDISGKISSAVFETTSVSAVGGIMLFKTSYKVESFNNTTIILDTKYNGIVGDKVYLTNADGKLSSLLSITAINEKQVTLNSQPFSNETNVQLTSLIQIGKEIDGQPPIVIGVNSTDTDTGFLKHQGITVAEVYDNGTSIIKTFLGNLAALNINNVNGYGLYGSNVYLTGSLTTQVQSTNNPSYAGINTLNGASAVKFGSEDNSKIVFWAGSEGINNDQIAAAPFQVTEQGSLYASRGIFEGSIISRSIIEGSVIRTARIEGTGANPALKILDALNGIGFYTIESNEDKEVFTIGTEGFRAGENHFITIASDGQVNFTGNNIAINSLQTKNTNGISLNISQNIIQSEYGNNNMPSITFSSESIDWKIQSNINRLSVTENLTTLNTDVVTMKKDVVYGQNIMKYEAVENGYNLYVLE